MRGTAILISASVLLSGSVLVSAAPAAATPIGLYDAVLHLERSEQVAAIPYDRNEFAHWIDADGDGCNTRAEVLTEESEVPVTVNAGCTVLTGRWTSLYDGAVWTDASNVDIDHVVALKEAWESGAAGWTADQRRDFANDLDYARTLRAVTDSVNQSKGASDPSAWMPPATEAHCEYLADWVSVKYRWRLWADGFETYFLLDHASNACADTTVELPQQRLDVVPGTGAPVTEIEPFAAGVTRLGGADRYATSALVTARFAPGIPILYVANGQNYPDALGAGPAAAAQGGAVLLTKPGSIPDVTLREIQRLQPAHIVVVGSEASVSASVYNQLAALAPQIRRDAGPDRYSTNRAIVANAFPGAESVMIADGRNFPDALAASAAAGSRSIPVILVPGASSMLQAPTLQLLNQLGVNTAVVAGSTNSVSAGIASDLWSAAGISVTRLGGADRMATAALINDHFFDATSAVFLTLASKFPDALSGGALAAQLGAPMYLVGGSCVSAALKSRIESHGASSIVILGSTDSIKASMESLTVCATPPPPPPPPPPPGPPANPGDSVNCSNFATWQQAQAWFDKYYPHYGDVAKLDADNDKIACESLPGAPS